jgi:CheY-like chemotaxis protein
LENAIAVEDNSSHVAVSVEEDGKEVVVAPEEATGKSSEAKALSLPFKSDYIFIGVGAFVLLMLLFLLMRKPKKATDKELKELYEQAQQLEEEMNTETGEETLPISPVHTETEVTEADAVGAKAEVRVAPTKTGELNHKLRDPNKDVTSITKDNFKEFAGLRLLIAEDNLINQKVIVGLLKESGINIKIANDGQERLEILEKDSHYPIILMDAHMPRIDGLEATRQIRANPAYNHITVMALSGDTGADDIRKMREVGMEEQLEKPLKIMALYQALYCYFDPNNISGEEEALPEIHLDNSLGLEMLGGDIELYHEILSEFQSLYHDSDEKVKLWLKDEDYDSAKALLLDVKGIGESIGTPELTLTAEEFREAIIAGDSENYPKLLNRYSSHLKSILADIAEV